MKTNHTCEDWAHLVNIVWSLSVKSFKTKEENEHFQTQMFASWLDLPNHNN